MTLAEAKARFGIKDTDSIKKDGIQYLLKNAEEQQKVWSLSRDMREEINKDINAYKKLLEVAV